MIIKDDSLSKYEIDVDGTSFTLRYPTTITTDKKTGKEVQNYNVVGYFSTLEGALTKAAKLLAIEKCGDVATLNEVISNFKEIWNDVKQTILI